MEKAIMQLAVPDIQHTIPDVFIIESLSEKDRKEGRLEGEVLSQMLRLSGKNPKYYYVEKESELRHIVGLFRESQYRFLHISSHASKVEIGTHFGNISYSHFSNIFEGHLKLRRLFFSACEIGNDNFVKSISLQNKGMHSIVAPTEPIRFDHAAAIWSSLYVSLFTENEDSMRHQEIEKRLRILKDLFPVQFFFGSYSPKKDCWYNRVV